MCKYNC